MEEEKKGILHVKGHGTMLEWILELLLVLITGRISTVSFELHGLKLMIGNLPISVEGEVRLKIPPKR